MQDRVGDRSVGRDTGSRAERIWRIRVARAQRRCEQQRLLQFPTEQFWWEFGAIGWRGRPIWRRPATVIEGKRKSDIMLTRLTRTVLIAGTAFLLARTGEGKTFSTPEEARDALIEAAQKGLDDVRALFGPESADIVRTGDEVEDRAALATFNTLASEKAVLESEDTIPNRRTLVVGIIEWPFAIPLTSKGGRWYWDVVEGKAEIRRRVIGANELNAIEICRGYVAAQTTYAETDWDGNGVM